jgi:hypothetical protein
VINRSDCPHFTQYVTEKTHRSAPPAACLLAAGLAAGTPRWYPSLGRKANKCRFIEVSVRFRFIREGG